MWFKNFLAWFKKPEVFSDKLTQRLTGYRNVTTGKVSKELLQYNILNLTTDDGYIFPTLLTLESGSSDAQLQAWVPQGWASQQDEKPIEVMY